MSNTDFKFYSAEAFERHIQACGPKFLGGLYLRGCTSLTALPDGLTVGGAA